MSDAAPDYMAGLCHVFAAALHREFGWSFLILLDTTQRYPGGVYAVNHVYALDGQGKAYDQVGIHDEADVVAQWMYVEHPGFQRPSVRRAVSEAALRKYVGETEDDWDRPLAAYTDADVEAALAEAKERLAGHFVSVPPR